MKRVLLLIVLVTIAITSVLSCQKVPTEIHVSSISISESILELTVGDQHPLDVIISPDNATNKLIIWRSSKESVATVSPDGIVEAGSAGTAYITATSEDSGVSARCEIIVKEKAINVTGIALNKTSIFLEEGEEFTLEATITPDNATNKAVIWKSDNETAATVSAHGVVKAIKAGTAIITATTVDQGKTASCTVSLLPTSLSAVDLGLSVKWATFNLGASKVTEYGGYYQWAGTEDVSDTNIKIAWYNCPYHTGVYSDLGWSKYNTIPSYGTVDNKSVLEPMDDAASVALGGKWRMPTDEEWSELRNPDNCYWTWTTINGVNGIKVQSKKSGFTKNWIFLPAAGFRNDNSFYDVERFGFYWSSSQNTDKPREAWCIYFFSDDFCRDCDFRLFGQSIRPVSE